MIKTLLQQAQNFLGKDFVIAALFPTLLWSAALSFMWMGRQECLGLVAGALESKRALAIHAGGAFIAAFLVAYVLYGVRSSLHSVYEGHWGPFTFFAVPFDIWAYGSCMRAHNRLNSAVFGMSCVEWGRKGFGPAFFDGTISAWQLRIDRWDVGFALCLKRIPWFGPRILAASTPSLFRLRASDKGDSRSPALCWLFKRRLTAQHDGILDRRHDWAEARYLRAFNEAQSFPAPHRVRPTDFGTAVAAYEEYSNERYGIDMTVLFTRLLFVTDDKVQSRLNGASTYIDFALISSFLCGTLACMPLLAYSTARGQGLPVGDHSWLLTALWATAFYFFYRIAVISLRAYGELVRAFVDLYRGKVLDAMEIERASTLADERALWRKLKDIITFGKEADVALKKSLRPGSMSSTAPKDGDKGKTA